MNSESCPQCGAPLEEHSPEGLCPACLLSSVLAPTEPSLEDAPPTLEAVAQAFPQLQIDSLIGRGGMGAVYKAYQPHLERWVALKVLPTDLSADQAFADRFSREARVLAKLNHPNIVTLHDFGQAGEFFFLLMEFVDGVNLRQAMQAGKFTPEQALGVVPKICEALQYAHGEGILHRDIKPDNILLDSRGHLKIADFGIAKVVGNEGEHLPSGSDAPPSSMLTHASTSLGTPQYMAPEQMTDPNTVDHRADIYSLGVVFYEMLTGELPTGNFVPPSQMSSVDDRIDGVVERALEQERGQRQQSAEEMRTEVETIAQTPPEIPQPTIKRRFGAAWAAAFICLGLLVPLLAMMGIRILEMREMSDQTNARVADAIISTTGVAEREISQRLSETTDPVEITRLEEEQTRVKRERAKAEAMAPGEQTTFQRNTYASDSLRVAVLLLLVVSLGFLIFGMSRGWRHLSDLRHGRVQGRRGLAMFAALFLPLVLLFVGVMALILIPVGNGRWSNPRFAQSLGTSLALLAACLSCFWVTRATWRWSHNISKTSRDKRPRSMGLLIGCFAVFAVVVLVSVPVALLVYWNKASVQQPSFSAPASASVGNNTDSTYCVYVGNDVNFILHYAGDFSTSTSGSSNHVNRTWNNEGVVTLPNKRTVAFYRHSGDPNTLRLNGRVFRLDEGRVLVISETVEVEQLDMEPMRVKEQGELKRFAEALRLHQIERRAAQFSTGVPFEGSPKILCLQWQLPESEQPVTWGPDGRLMNRPEDLIWLETLHFPPHVPTNRQVLMLAIEHSAFDLATSIKCEFYDTEGLQTTYSSSVAHPMFGAETPSTIHPLGAGLTFPPPLRKTISLKLKASGGEWERRPERFLKDSFDKRIRFRDFDSITIHTSSKEGFKVGLHLLDSMDTDQLKVVAILHSGERVDRVFERRTYRCEFEGVSLAEVQALEFYTRPFQEFTYTDLPLMPYPTNNGIRGLRE